MIDPLSSELMALQAALAGEYSLERELGRGGMGVVYLARDVQLDRDVAIKVLPTHMARQPESRERFLREARTAAGLSHPHIVSIHRVGEAGGFVFFVMSYVAGETLGERLRREGPLPPAEAMRVLREVAWALAYAHGRGIVHRDVKPDNILLEAGTGRALVTDFGIAHGGDRAAPDTDPGRIMGTAHFMSPEQAASEPLDGRSDIYSLGVVGYVAVSGRLPFDSPNLPALLMRQAMEIAPSVMHAAPGLPPALAQAIDRCLERDPSRRFTDGEAMAAALVPPVDSRPSLPTSLRIWLGARNPALTAYAAWSGMFTVSTVGQTLQMLNGNQHSHVSGALFTAAAAVAPLIPIVGFHLNQARRLFSAGHTLADLRTALDVGAREQSEGEALVVQESVRLRHAFLRIATYAATTWSAVTVFLLSQNVIRPGAVVILAPAISTLALAAASNALEVQLIPSSIRARLRLGIRERLWRSRFGGWLAERMGAPARSRVASGAAFRPTEAALGLAASDLFDALPKAHREQLAALPATVTALEQRAAAARAELVIVAALAPAGDAAAGLLAARREDAAAQLASSVAALEGIRLDLLRLHAGASDLSPLTTLMDAARAMGDDIVRLADAQRELGGPPPSVRRVATPV